MWLPDPAPAPLKVIPDPVPPALTAPAPAIVQALILLLVTSASISSVVPVTLDAPSIFAVTLSVILFTATESPTAIAFGGPRATVIAMPPACVSISLWSFAFTEMRRRPLTLPPVIVA